MRGQPIRIDGFLSLREYALVSDGRSCMLAGSDGLIDWWALSMAGDPSFGAMLDPDRGGSLALRPVGEFEVSRHYVEGGAVLATLFRTPTGSVRVTDALTLDAGAPLPWVELARQVVAVDGEVQMRWEVVPGDRFGATVPCPRMFAGTPMIDAGTQRFALVLDHVGEPKQGASGFSGTFTARPGSSGLLAVIGVDGTPIPVPPVEAINRRLYETVRHWSHWSEQISYDGPWLDAVTRSALVHKQLTLAETGALQGAGTTSLPEQVGGSHNMDYRFCWVRDTGFALNALSNLSLRSEVHAVLSYLVRTVGRTAPDVQAFYTMAGTEASAEVRPIPFWRGYRHSSPVTSGNKAAQQRQLGSYGDLLEAIAHYARAGNVLDGRTRQLVAQIADQVCTQWREPDAGLWELPMTRPYTSSKIGCWAALDRAVRLAEAGQVPDGQIERWRASAEWIRAYINEACWSRTKSSYTFYAGTDQLDCATLLVARTGFCAGDDPHLHGTIEAIRSELSATGGLLYRYSGTWETEGAFIACSFWLVEALSVAGRLDEARELMDEMVERTNDVGLLTEEIDPKTGELLGNMPQLLSHLALISAATTYHAQVGGR